MWYNLHIMMKSVDKVTPANIVGKLLRGPNATLEQFDYEVEGRSSLVTAVRAGHTPGGLFT